MGGKPRPKQSKKKKRQLSLSPYKHRIKRFNQIYRFLLRFEAPTLLLDVMAEMKDEQITAMTKACIHSKVIEAPPDTQNKNVFATVAMRTCTSCGETELLSKDGWKILTDSADRLDRMEFMIAQGKTLKRLGINL